MKTGLDQAKPIFWGGKICKFIKWESLTIGGNLKIKVGSQFIEVNISELKN